MKQAPLRGFRCLPRVSAGTRSGTRALRPYMRRPQKVGGFLGPVCDFRLRLTSPSGVRRWVGTCRSVWGERADVGGPLVAREVPARDAAGGGGPMLGIEVPDLGGIRAVVGLAAYRQRAAVERQGDPVGVVVGDGD